MGFGGETGMQKGLQLRDHPDSEQNGSDSRIIMSPGPHRDMEES